MAAPEPIVLTPEQQVECDNELLECARYGEDDDLSRMLSYGAKVDHTDAAGNTGAC